MLLPGRHLHLDPCLHADAPDEDEPSYIISIAPLMPVHTVQVVLIY